MALLQWPLLLSISISFVRAGPLSTDSLTPYITNVVPKCAQRCLQSFVADNYPVQVCTPQNFNCLCITPTTSGYTIGEGASTCLVSTCSKQEASVSNRVYRMCYDIPGAQPNTHSTLAATYDPEDSRLPAQSTKRTTARSSRSSQSSSSTPTSSATSTSTASANRGTTMSNIASSAEVSNLFSSSTIFPPSDTVLPTNIVSASASASSTPSAQPTLTKPQIAGVVVASVGAAALAFGLCLLLVCLKRKKRSERPQSGSSFGDYKNDSRGRTPNMSGTQTNDFAFLNDPRTKSQPKPRLHLETPSRADSGGWQEWRRNVHPSPRNIGLALGPEGSQTALDGPSPTTPASYRTHSQLLPDRPGASYSLFPQPLRNSRRASQVLMPPIPAYAPEKYSPMNGPGFPTSNDTSQTYLQVDSRQRSLSDPFYITPATSPRQGYRGVPFTEQPAAIVKAQLAHHSFTAELTEPYSAAAKEPSWPQSYPPPPSMDQHYMAAIDRSHSRKHPARNKSTGSSHYTRSTRFSNGSETSFEEDENPLPRSVLSPVAETQSPPQQRSSKIAYPAVPTTAAESTARIINRPRPSTRKQSLAAKRRGEDKAAELSSGLQAKSQRRSAKWQVLVSPGLQSLNSDKLSSSSPHTIQTASSGGAPPVPPMSPLRASMAARQFNR